LWLPLAASSSKRDGTVVSLNHSHTQRATVELLVAAVGRSQFNTYTEFCF